MVITHDALCNKRSFLKEREDPYDDGIWTRPRFTTAFSVSGPVFLVNHPGFTDMERDTLAQL